MEAARQRIQEDPEKKNEGKEVKIRRKMVRRKAVDMFPMSIIHDPSFIRRAASVRPTAASVPVFPIRRERGGSHGTERIWMERTFTGTTQYDRRKRSTKVLSTSIYVVEYSNRPSSMSSAGRLASIRERWTAVGSNGKQLERTCPSLEKVVVDSGSDAERGDRFRGAG